MGRFRWRSPRLIGWAVEMHCPDGHECCGGDFPTLAEARQNGREEPCSECGGPLVVVSAEPVFGGA